MTDGFGRSGTHDTRANETCRLAVLFLAYTGFASARWRRCASPGSTSTASVL